MRVAASVRIKAIANDPNVKLFARTILDRLYHPTDTELVTAEIIARGNFNEHGGELGEEDRD